MAVIASLAAFLSTIALGYLVIVAAAAVAGALARGGRRERAMEAYEGAYRALVGLRAVVA